MELSKTETVPVNGVSESVDIEAGLVYDMLKSSDIRKSMDHTSSRKQVIVTQRKIGDDTSWIEAEYPKTWGYLVNNG
ncbi:SAM-dependent methyltransferase, partial [Streptococcus thermophilus]|nr:SAM-dependent methyltransferase [Streptococcus thermophilus]